LCIKSGQVKTIRDAQAFQIYLNHYSEGVVLNNLDLEISKGDTIAVSGPSVQGKTTLLNLIGCLTGLIQEA